MLRKAQVAPAQALASAFQPLDVAAVPVFSNTATEGGPVSTPSFVTVAVGGGKPQTFVPSSEIGDGLELEEQAGGVSFTLATVQQYQTDGVACGASRLEAPAELGNGPWNLVSGLFAGGADGRSFIVLTNTGSNSLDLVEVIDSSAVEVTNNNNNNNEDDGEGDALGTAAAPPGSSVSLQFCGSLSLDDGASSRPSAVATLSGSISAGVVVGFSNGTVAYATLNNDTKTLHLVHRPSPIPGFAKSQISCLTFLRGGGGDPIVLASCGPVIVPLTINADRIAILKPSVGGPQYQALKVKSSSVWQERVTAMDEDGSGNVVVGTASGGLFVFDLRNPRTPVGHLVSTAGGAAAGGLDTTSTGICGRVSGIRFGSSPQSFVTTTSAGEVRQWSVADQVSAATTFPYKSILLQSPENGNGVLSLTSLPTPEFHREGYLLSDEGGASELYF